MASSKAGEPQGSRSWGKTGRSRSGRGALFAIFHPALPSPAPARSLSCRWGSRGLTRGAALPPLPPRSGDLLSTRARRERARLQGSCEVRRDWASRGDVRIRWTSGRVHCHAERSAFGVELLIWRKQGKNVLWVQFLGGGCGTQNRRASDTTHSAGFLL